MKTKLKLVVLFFFGIILCSCTNKTKVVDLGYFVEGEYYMHVGSSKQIFTETSYFGENTKEDINLTFKNVEGNNLEPIEFQIGRSQVIYINCTSLIKETVEIKKIIYIDDENNEYHQNADIKIYDEDSYNELEPAFYTFSYMSNYNIKYSYFLTDIYILLDKSYFGKNITSLNLENVYTKYDDFELELKYCDFQEDNYYPDFEKLEHYEFDDSLDFYNKSYWLYVKFIEIEPSDVNGAKHFDIFFDFTINGDKYTLARNIIYFH